MVGAVTGLAGYRIELPVPLARKVAPYQRLKAVDRAGAVVTGNSDFGAVGSEFPRHCRQHQISARKDPGLRGASMRLRAPLPILPPKLAQFGESVRWESVWQTLFAATRTDRRCPAGADADDDDHRHRDRDDPHWSTFMRVAALSLYREEPGTSSRRRVCRVASQWSPGRYPPRPSNRALCRP